MFDLHHYQTAADLLGSTALAFQFMPGLRGAPVDHRISRSLRHNSADSASSSRTPASAGNRKVLAQRFRIKRGKLGVAMTISSAGASSIDEFYFDSSDRLCLDVLGTTRLVTTQVFRDPEAWYDVGFELDVGNGTAALRAKILIFEVEAASYSTDTRSSISNTDTNWNNTVAHYIGRDNGGNYFDGLIAEPAGVDGSKVIIYSEIDPVTGVRLPRKPVAAWGTNGFYLDFSDNSGVTSSTLGKDRSGNNNDWTPSNLSVTAGVGNDSLVDTPTPYGVDSGAGGEVRGNYCTLDALRPFYSGGGGALSNGNLKAVSSGAGSFAVSHGGSIGVTSGKWYWEVLVEATNGAYPYIGICAGGAKFESDEARLVSTTMQYMADGVKDTGGTTSAYGAAYTTNDVIGVALDMDAGTITFYKNSVSQGTAFSSGLATTAIPKVALYNGAGVTFNFGQRPFAYAAPSGFKALCTQNLPTPSIKKVTDGFVQATESGANIATAVAALRPGWISYIEIFRRLDSGEGWRVRGSSDTGNYLDFSSTAAKTTFPSLSGATYLGMAIRCDAGYPARTGIVSHTNGAATTITNNLGTARRLILIKREDSTSAWFLYHPDLTAGKLLYLNTTDAETTDGSIASVTSNAFNIGSGAASGTYRYIEIAAQDGFFALGKYASNNSTDGPFSWAGLRPTWWTGKSLGGTSAFAITAVRNPYNPATNAVQINGAGSGEVTYDAVDLLAGGVKLRSNTNINASGQNIVWWAFGSPFKYARAA